MDVTRLFTMETGGGQFDQRTVDVIRTVFRDTESFPCSRERDVVFTFQSVALAGFNKRGGFKQEGQRILITFGRSFHVGASH
jgi:hypothetical protein